MTDTRHAADNQRRIAIAVIELEPIPPPGALDADTWQDWCADHRIHPLGAGAGRRGWSNEAGSYLRGATWIARLGGDSAPILLDDDELAALQACPRCGCGIEPGAVHDPRLEDSQQPCAARALPRPGPERTGPSISPRVETALSGARARAVASFDRPFAPTPTIQKTPYLLATTATRTGPTGSQNGWQNPKRLAVRLAALNT